MVETKLSINVKIKNTFRYDYCPIFLRCPNCEKFTDY